MSRRPLDVADDIDPVAVLRAINGTDVGRPLHDAEKLHIVKHHPHLDLAAVLGCSTGQLRDYEQRAHERYGYHE